MQGLTFSTAHLKPEAAISVSPTGHHLSGLRPLCLHGLFGIYRSRDASEPHCLRLLIFLAYSLMTSFHEGNQETQDSRREKGSLGLSEDQQKRRIRGIKPVPRTNLIKLCIGDPGGLFGEFRVLDLFLEAIGIITAPWAPRRSEQVNTPSCLQTLLSPSRCSLDLSKRSVLCAISSTYCPSGTLQEG